MAHIESDEERAAFEAVYAAWVDDLASATTSNQDDWEAMWSAGRDWQRVQAEKLLRAASAETRGEEKPR